MAPGVGQQQASAPSTTADTSFPSNLANQLASYGLSMPQYGQTPRQHAVDTPSASTAPPAADATATEADIVVATATREE